MALPSFFLQINVVTTPVSFWLFNKYKEALRRAAYYSSLIAEKRTMPGLFSNLADTEPQIYWAFYFYITK